MSDPAEIALQYRRFADLECKGYSDAYYRLALDVADEDDVLAFVAQMPVSQPNLFFASVQYLTGPDRMPGTGVELKRFVQRRGADVADVMRSRRTQTNEVGRCAVLLPALPSGPLALVEVGASAGLCLLLDQFHYQFGARSVGVAGSPVSLRCALAGPVPVPPAVPEIAWRHGLDLHPLDVRDEAAARWLRACVWPDHHERRRRLEGAIDLARAEPPGVRRGDLVEDLPALLAEAPDDAQLVVFHSAVLSYLSADRRRAFADVLVHASKGRDIVWLSNEAPGIVAGVTALAPPWREHRFLLGRTRVSNGRGHDEFLAHAHPHGADLTWHGRSARPNQSHQGGRHGIAGETGDHGA